MASTALLTENGESSRIALQKAVWLMAAVALNAAELAIPRLPFFPWLKPGFANIITVLWIIRFGFADAVLYTALRVWISGFYFGFSLFTFSLSIGGGLLSTVAMAAMWAVLGKRGLLGTVGAAIVGALFHNIGQLVIVYFMMSRNMGVLGQIPFMLGASLVFGGIVGALVPAAAKIFYCDNSANNINDVDNDGKADNNIHTDTDNNADNNPNTITNKKFINKFIVVLTFAVSVSLMFVDNIYVLIAAMTAFSLISFALNPKKPGVVLYPVKFYMLFIFIAATHLFFSYGVRIEFIPFITEEGLFSFVKQSLRLWCWLQTVHVFKKFNFQEIFITTLYKFFPNRKDTLNAGMITLAHFPEIIRFAKTNRKITVSALLFNPGIAPILTEYLDEVKRRIKI